MRLSLTFLPLVALLTTAGCGTVSPAGRPPGMLGTLSSGAETLSMKAEDAWQKAHDSVAGAQQRMVQVFKNISSDLDDRNPEDDGLNEFSPAAAREMRQMRAEISNFGRAETNTRLR